MARKPDGMVVFENVLSTWPSTDPWQHGPGDALLYEPDFALLSALLAVPLSAGSVSETGVFPKGIDLWLAMELRRAGFHDHETWPRATRPRVLPREIALLLEALPRRLAGYPGLDLREELRRRVNDLPSVTPTDAKVLGRAYDKQVDVCISRWDRGPEVLISTKAQLSSFGKNLPNRFEEAYGDAANLRARYPLAATGYVFVQRASILATEPDAFERTKDMMRKLRAEGDGPGYTATGLCLVDWDDGDPARLVTIRHDVVPEGLSLGSFLAMMIGQVLRTTPVTHHVRVRELFEGRSLPVEEADTADEADAQASEMTPDPTVADASDDPGHGPRR